MSLFLCFRGGVVRFFSYFRVAFWLGVLFSVCLGFAFFGNKFLINEKNVRKSGKGVTVPCGASIVRLGGGWGVTRFVLYWSVIDSDWLSRLKMSCVTI